jgi:hypothetical protein
MTAEVKGNVSSDTKIDSFVTAETNKGEFNTSNLSYITYDAQGTNDQSLDGAVKCYALVHIGEAETGNDGVLKLNFMVKTKTSGNWVVETSINLKVRKVKKVALTVAENSKGNIAGSEIELEAETIGYGSASDYYYFKKQTYKDEDGVTQPYEWDASYCSPYNIKWTYVDANGEHDITLLNGITISTKTNSILRFTIDTPLDSGIKIKATALHSLGTVGGTNYNRSGVGYGGTGGISSQIELFSSNSSTSNSSSSSAGPISVEKDKYVLSKGDELILPVSVSVDGVSKLKLYFNSWAVGDIFTIESVSCDTVNGSKLGDESYEISISNSGEDKMVTCYVTIKANQESTGTAILYLEPFDKNGSKIPYINVEFNIK